MTENDQNNQPNQLNQNGNTPNSGLPVPVIALLIVAILIFGAFVVVNLSNQNVNPDQTTATEESAETADNSGATEESADPSSGEATPEVAQETVESNEPRTEEAAGTEESSSTEETTDSEAAGDETTSQTEESGTGAETSGDDSQEQSSGAPTPTSVSRVTDSIPVGTEATPALQSTAVPANESGGGNEGEGSGGAPTPTSLSRMTQSIQIGTEVTPALQSTAVPSVGSSSDSSEGDGAPTPTSLSRVTQSITNADEDETAPTEENTEGSSSIEAANTTPEPTEESGSSGDSAQAPESEFISVDAENQTVTLTVIAAYDETNGGLNFNGYANGEATYTVPQGWTVNVEFQNNADLPHSAMIVAQDAVSEQQLPDPVFEGASTSDPFTGTTESGSFSFTAESEGSYALACGVPGHAANGHWIVFEVAASDTQPSLQLGENQPFVPSGDSGGSGGETSAGGQAGNDEANAAPTLPIPTPVAGLPQGAPFALAPQGDVARSEANLFWLMLGLGTVIYIGVMFLVLRAFLQRRRENDPSMTEQQANWFIAGGGVAMPAVVLTLLFFLTVMTLDALAVANQPTELTIDVTGYRWWWHVSYPEQDFVTANEIHIPAGQPVRFNLASADVLHSFWVPELGGKMDMIPGRTNSMWLEADQPGEYRGQCAEFCGAQHAKMAFLVIAHEPSEFEQWVQNQQQPAQEPADELTAQGQEVFLNSGCIACHAIRGTGAQGVQGPDLTHFGSRRTIGAGTLPNTTGHLAGWIVDSQGVKPGNLMPPQNVVGLDLQALLAYLQSLT
jgi:cytochrome c oxidase subunit II